MYFYDFSVSVCIKIAHESTCFPPADGEKFSIRPITRSDRVIVERSSKRNLMRLVDLVNFVSRDYAEEKPYEDFRATWKKKEGGVACGKQRFLDRTRGERFMFGSLSIG